MAGERVAVMEAPEAVEATDAQAPKPERVVFNDGGEADVTYWRDGTSSLVRTNPETGEPESMMLGVEETANLKADIEAYRAELAANSTDATSGNEELGSATSHDKDNSSTPQPDQGEDSIEQPVAEPKQLQDALPKTEKVVVSGDEPAKAGDVVNVRKSGERRSKPEATETEKIGKRIGFLTAKISEIGIAITEAQREGRNEDAQKLIAELDGFKEEKKTLRQRERDLAVEEYAKGDKKLDPDAEAAASKARTDKMADDMDAIIQANLDKKYPSTEVQATPEAAAATDEDLDRIIAENKQEGAKDENGPGTPELKELSGELTQETVESLRKQEDEYVKSYQNSDKRTPEAAEWLEKLEQIHIKLRLALATEGQTGDVLAESKNAAAAEESAPKAPETEPTEPTPPESPEAPVKPEAVAKSAALESEHARSIERFYALGRERRLAEQQKDLVDVEKHFKEDPETQSIRDNLELARDRYTRLKAKSETWGRWGRRKREIELTEAEQALKNAELVYARSLTDAKVAAGFLNAENPEDQRYMRGEQMFSTQRELINLRRANVKEFRQNKIENANWLMKGAAAVGNFLNSGGKWGKRLRSAGLITAGAGAGVMTALSGAGWPIAAIASTGVGHGIRGASIVDRLNKQVADIGEGGKDNGYITKEMFDNFMEYFKESGRTIDEDANMLGQYTLDRSRVQGYENADAAREQGNKLMHRYGLGFAIGGFATLGVNLFNGMAHAGAAHAGVAQADPTHSVVNVHPNEGVVPSDRYPTQVPHEFARGADRITDGEGWFSQFRDMGMSDKEAHALFGDDNVMKQLVEADAAYPDDSSRIGGYGINMPKGGHLSQKAMEIIGKAMEAKGF